VPPDYNVVCILHANINLQNKTSVKVKRLNCRKFDMYPFINVMTRLNLSKLTHKLQKLILACLNFRVSLDAIYTSTIPV
jgi:hypothetical protein